MKKFILGLVIASLAPGIVMAQELEHTYVLTQTGLQQIVNMLQEVPAKWANPIISEITKQAQASDARAALAVAETAKKKPEGKK